MRALLWMVVCGCLLGADAPEGLKPGMPAAEVKKAQEAWARHLGQPANKRVQVLHGVELELSLVPPGEMVMGSPEAENKDNGAELPHEVALTKPWYAGVHEVTQAQWEAVMGGNPSRFKKEGAEKAAFPVENVSHNDCQRFVEKLRALTGLPFRLPKEAEWEYATRAGTNTPFWWGESLNGKEANCNGGKPFGTMEPGPALGKPCRVRSYAANPLVCMTRLGMCSIGVLTGMANTTRRRGVTPRGRKPGSTGWCGEDRGVAPRTCAGLAGGCSMTRPARGAASASGCGWCSMCQTKPRRLGLWM